MRRMMSALVLIAGAAQVGAAPQESPAVGAKVADFALADFRGKQVRLADFADKPIVVVAFLGVECPLAKQYAPRLEELAREYATKGVQFLAVDANQQDSVTEMGHFARTHGVTFPLLKDVGNVVADAMDARRTPEIFVLDRDRVVRYRGRVDDQYGFKTGGGYAQPKAKSHDLTNALDELLAGKAVSVPVTKADGCVIGRIRTPNEKSDVTYAKQVARILQDRCVHCHRPGEIGPFALQSYDEVAGWAEMIDEVVQDQRMPPWHADERYGHWANDSRLSAEDKRLIHEWVENGAPQGDPKDLPEPKTYTDGWQIGEPDAIVYMSDQSFAVAADGTIDYQYFTVDPGFEKDTWIKAVECRPGNRSVVHHIIVFVQPPGVQAQMFEGGPANLALLQGEAPGMPATILPDGMAFFVPAKSKLVFQLHYTANGTPQEDRSCVGLVFADPAQVKHEARTFNAGNPFFEIPPHAANHPVDAEFRFWSDTQLVSLMPHMHLRGKSFRYTLKHPDGHEEILLDVPRYDFNWQNMYFFAEPKVAPKGSVLQCVAHFDNSEGNLANPDPSKSVRWGEQTWEEMMLGWFVCTMDGETATDGSRTKSFLELAEKSPPKADLNANLATLGAFKSGTDFRRFSRVVQGYVPQVDRIDVALIEGPEMRFLFVAQPAILNSKIGSTDFRLPIERAALAMFMQDDKVVVNPRLSAITGEDIARIGVVMKSALHIPVRIAGKPALFSFWSRETEAFPPAAQEFLTGVARLATKNAKLPSAEPAAKGTSLSER